MKKSAFTLTALCVLLLSSCSAASENALQPLMGLDWYTAYDAVKETMSSYTLLEERETGDTVRQFMQDYENVTLFDNTCDLTLCFTDAGLIGFNYHDMDHHQNYKEWYQTLETTYGLPTEEGSGMASWYGDPAGKNTSLYLFNLEEGVQVSIYVTADSPDKSYAKDGSVLTPEIRTPIVPVTIEEPAAASTGSTAADAAETVSDEPSAAVSTASEESTGRHLETARNAPENETAASEAAETETASLSGAAAETETEPQTDRTYTFLPDGLQFYSDPDSGRRYMSAYTQTYEYRTEEAGQPWELIMEYAHVPYEGKSCDAVLCFTSLGLVGVNYFDSSTSNYQYWVDTLTDIYGTPDETQYDYTAWSRSPVGSGTMIYVFALEDGVQISFFADDTGSELT